MRQALIAISFLLFAIGTYTLWMPDNFALFFKMLAWLLLGFNVLLITMTTGIARDVWIVASFCCLSNVIDEHFFDPTKVGKNEYFFLALIILSTVLKIIYVRHKRGTTRIL